MALPTGQRILSEVFEKVLAPGLENEAALQVQATNNQCDFRSGA